MTEQATQKAKEATLTQIRSFMGMETMRVKDFKAEWDALPADVQSFYRTEVGKAVNA